jgi:hypothetical protein
LVGSNQLTGEIPLPPNPSALVFGGSNLCPNNFPASSFVASAAWDAATATTPWYLYCDDIFYAGFE